MALSHVRTTFRVESITKEVSRQGRMQVRVAFGLTHVNEDEPLLEGEGPAILVSPITLLFDRDPHAPDDFVVGQDYLLDITFTPVVQQ